MKQSVAAYISNAGNLQQHPLFLLIAALAEAHPDQLFVVWHNGEAIKDLRAPNNFEAIPTKFSKASGVKFTFWKKVTLPAWLKKNNVSQLVSDEMISLNAAKLFLYLNDFYRSNKLKLKTLSAADKIFTSSQSLSFLLQKKYPSLAASIVSLAHTYAPMPQPMRYAQKEAVADKYANGHHFILALINEDSIDNAVILLKAFSVFKKWQKSSMKLALLFADGKRKEDIPGLASYKYLPELLFFENGEEINSPLIPASYGNILLAPVAADESFIIQSLQSRVPLILQNSEAMKEAFGNLGLFANNGEHSIADVLMKVYKEAYSLPEDISIVQDFEIQSTAEKLYQLLG